MDSNPDAPIIRHVNLVYDGYLVLLLWWLTFTPPRWPVNNLAIPWIRFGHLPTPHPPPFPLFEVTYAPILSRTLTSFYLVFCCSIVCIIISVWLCALVAKLKFSRKMANGIWHSFVDSIVVCMCAMRAHVFMRVLRKMNVTRLFRMCYNIPTFTLSLF